MSRLECEAFDDGRQVGYRFKARGSYASLLPVSLTTPEVVTPAGREPFGSLPVAGIVRLAA